MKIVTKKGKGRNQRDWKIKFREKECSEKKALEKMDNLVLFLVTTFSLLIFGVLGIFVSILYSSLNFFQ